MGAVFIITKFKTESPAVKKNGKRKRPAPNRHGSKIKSAASQKNSGVVAAIAAGVAYCNAPPLIPQGQKRKMFLMAENFLKVFFDTEKGGCCHPPFSISVHYISFL